MHTQNMHAQQQQLINGAWVVGDAEPFTKHDPVRRWWSALSTY